VLLHGGGDRWQGFMPILPQLATRWHIFALDLRGHGKSGRIPGQYRPEHYVADVIAFLESEFLQPVILFGHSLGGWIALLVAAQQQDKVRALILGDPPLNIERFLAVEGTEERLEMWRTVRSQLADSGLVDPDVVQYHAEGRLVEYVENVNPDAALRSLSCPVLLLQADPSQGGLVSDSDVQHALSLLFSGLHAKLEGAGHDLGLSTSQVAPLLRALTGFLESL
jgi:pimeloyl-ACP methyl ester carboxylesterase